jgi:hypothetical protein
MIKGPNLRIHGIEEGAEIQYETYSMKSQQKIFQVYHFKNSFQTPNRHDHKRTTVCHN